MGKRVASDERPYRPVQEALVRSILSHQDAQKEFDGIDQKASPYPNEVSALTLTSIDSKDSQNGKFSTPSPDEVKSVAAKKLVREKRVLLTLSEERELERLVNRMAEELETPVKLSHLLRAHLILFRHAENEVTKRAQQTGPLRRPPNGDPAGLAQFEHRLAQVLSAAFREAPPLR